MNTDWLVMNAGKIVGILIFISVIAFLKDKPQSLRVKVAGALGLVSLICFALVYFF
jgi:hypothetical protein